MKKFGICGLILLLAVAYSSIAYSAEAKEELSLQDSRKFIGIKFVRGFKNAALGWTEIPKRVVDIYEETNNPYWGIVAGIYQGTIKAIVKTTSGVVDIITCPVKSDEEPFIDPEIDVSTK